jgi:hypothetical protein
VGKLIQRRGITDALTAPQEDWLVRRLMDHERSRTRHRGIRNTLGDHPLGAPRQLTRQSTGPLDTVGLAIQQMFRIQL